MKKLLIILLLFFSAASQAQIITTFSPAGTRISSTPSVTITNSTAETTLFSDVIPANSLSPGKYYSFRIDIAVSTPAINLANLTIRIKYGAQTITVINGAGLTIGLTTAAPITITGNLVARTMSSQFLPIMVNQPMGNAIALTTSNAQARGLLTVNAAQNQTFSITAQFGGLSGGSCTLVTDWILRSDF